MNLNKTDALHGWIGHTVRHNEFAVNILEGAIFGKRQWEDRDCST